MKSGLLSIVLLLLSAQIICGQTDSDVDLYGCTVQSGGDVVLTWTPLSASADFASYDIYHAVGNGSFIKLTTISNSTVGTWTHDAGAADNQVHRYFIQAFASGVPTYPSDTLFTIVPMATNINDIEVSLVWQSYSVNTLPGAEPYYYVYRQSHDEPWTLIDSTLDLFYSDYPGICLNNLTYRISWRVNKNQNFSNLTLPMTDNNPPAAPVLDSVSVDENGHIVFGWEKGISPDTKEYFILHNTATWDTLDQRRFDFETTAYTTTTVDGTTGPKEFSIASIDRCGNATADNGITQSVKTIWLQQPQHQVCQKRITLNWTPYQRMKDGLAGYKILVSEDQAPYYTYDTVHPDTLSAFFLNPRHGVFYKFKIAALSNSGITASSSTVSLFVVNPAAPQYAYIRYATVDNNRVIDLALVNDTTAQTAGLVIERSLLSPVNYTVLDTLIPTAGTEYYTDSLVRPTKEPYLYRVQALDSCGAPEISSNIINSIYLTLSDKALGTLEWTPLEGFPNGLSSYQIERRTAETGWDLIGETTSGITTFTDAEYPSLIPVQSLEYRVKAYSWPNDLLPFSDTTTSNIITAVPSYRLFLPTAFHPGGERNNIFKPVMLSVDPSEYYFAVFNRQGQQIFESTSPETGWDGTLEGEKLKSGIYAYYIRILTVSGRYQEQRGMVTLVE